MKTKIYSLVAGCVITTILSGCGDTPPPAPEPPPAPKQAFVFVGATGDNALRVNGVWQGLYEAFAGGEFDEAGGVGIHVPMSSRHTEIELKEKVMDTLNSLYDGLQSNAGWSCKSVDGDCLPDTFFNLVYVNIQQGGRDADAQALDMAPSLAAYETVTMYLSVPPSAFAVWVEAADAAWNDGTDRVHAAVEKPFGVSTEDATSLHQGIIDGGLPDTNLHLVDHWLSFFMNKNLPLFRKLIEPRLGITFSSDTISKIIVKENEIRGLDGRGSFIDTVGQVRDMVQSHLLQVLGLTLIDDESTESRSAAKLAIFQNTNVNHCCFGQYKDFLLEPELSYHPSYASSTWCDVQLEVNTPAWTGMPVHIVTGKDMGELVYTVELHQKNGNGIVIIEVGKEETGLGGVRVENWPILDNSELVVPAGGFDLSSTVVVTPSVDDTGTGYIIDYNIQGMYFPKPYSVMVGALLRADYSTSFVTWEECLRQWEIVTSTGKEVCLDPIPEKCLVYRSPLEDGETCSEDSCSAENVCWQAITVADLYSDQFACNATHDEAYAGVSFYQAKCHSTLPAAIIV